MHLQIMEIGSFFQKLTIWNSLEVSKYKIIALKISQLTKGILQKKL
jgi:hypothetical protein